MSFNWKTIGILLAIGVAAYLLASMVIAPALGNFEGEGNFEVDEQTGAVMKVA